jgi:hypothetical protein
MAKAKKSTSKAKKGSAKKRVTKSTKLPAKSATKKVTGKKAGAKNTSALKALAMLAAPGTCLTLTRSAEIVQSCLPNGPHKPNKTLEECGLISPNSRLIFRECVFQGVLNEGCTIEKGQIPNSANTTVGEVIIAIQAKAS